MPNPTRKKVRAAMEALDYRVFDGIDRQGKKRNYDLNLFGVRTSGAVPNAFDDWVGVYWMDWELNDWQFHLWKATTDPGTYYLNSPMNVDGTAVLAEGQYPSSHQIGLHQSKYTALIQRGAVTVYRDNNKDSIIDVLPGSRQSGRFGINIHRASAHSTSTQVDRWSAGCQVLADPGDFAELLDICICARDIWGPTFTYTLLNDRQLA